MRNSNKQHTVVYTASSSIFVLLTSIFAAAKVFNYSDMSWAMVLSPLWGPFVLIISIVLALSALAAIYSLTAHIVNSVSRKRKK